MIFNSEDEKKQFMQEVIDKVLYCKGYYEELKELNTKYQIPTERKISHKAMDFKYNPED